MRADLPSCLTEALTALESASPSTRLLAGGTDLMVEIETGRTKPDRVIDLSRVTELRQIEETPDGLRLGALCTCTDLIEAPEVKALAPLLVEAAQTVGAAQIRNRATLGGNLGTASPAADLIPALLALDVSIRLRSRTGLRDIPGTDFLTGYRETARRSDELIDSVFLPTRDPNERQYFRKVGTRRAQAISKVVVALSATVDTGEIKSLSAAAGSVAERCVPLTSLSRELVGRPLNEAAIEAAIRSSLRADISPMDDVRSTADYRRQVLGRVLRTILANLLDSAPPESR